MTLTLNSILAMVWRTVKNPREGAAEVLSLGIPREALWTVLALVVVLSILLAQVMSLLVLSGGGAIAGPISIGPLATGFIQILLLILMVFAIYWIGKAVGGTGSFEEALLLVSWLQFIMVCLQAVQTVFVLILPPMATLIGVLGLALFLWLLTNFIAVLHNFRSLPMVFMMIILSAFGIAFGLSIILALIGVTGPIMEQL